MRLHPLVTNALDEEARAQHKSRGYLVEFMAKNFFGQRLATFMPGDRVAEAEDGPSKRNP